MRSWVGVLLATPAACGCGYCLAVSRAWGRFMRDLGDGISVRPLGRPASMVIVSLGLLDLLDRLLSTVGCPWIRGMALTAVARHRLGNGEAADREQQTNCQRSGCGELALRKRWAHAHLTHYPCRVRRRQPTAMPSTPIPTTSHHAFQKERGRPEHPRRRPILARVPTKQVLELTTAPNPASARANDGLERWARRHMRCRVGTRRAAAGCQGLTMARCSQLLWVLP